jgi:hypothetical protein
MNKLYFKNIFNYLDLKQNLKFPIGYLNISYITNKFLLESNNINFDIPFNILIKILDNIKERNINYNFNNLFLYFESRKNEYNFLKNKYDKEYYLYFRKYIYSIVFL